MGETLYFLWGYDVINPGMVGHNRIFSLSVYSYSSKFLLVSLSLTTLHEGRKPQNKTGGITACFVCKSLASPRRFTPSEFKLQTEDHALISYERLVALGMSGKRGTFLKETLNHIRVDGLVTSPIPVVRLKVYL